MTPFPAYLEIAIQQVFAEPNLINIQQHEWEMRKFMSLVMEELKPERTVELGTFRGFTGALLSLITSKQTISVDIDDHGTVGAKPYGHNLLFVRDDAATDVCANQIAAALGGPIDLLFIDDGHYYETIVKEYELWRPHVRPGGWVCFHDINVLANIGPHGIQPDSIQVPRFWKELKGDKLEIIADESHLAWKGQLPHGGIGVLKV
jgi:predicted O-methyltransferase YrrM